MADRPMVAVDGTEAVASVAHRLSEVIAIYPITPSSPMGEFSDEWSARGQTNLWGVVPDVVEMQSEGGAAGAVHGALQAGALTCTFTASQGLLLMIPNMYKIAGELNAFVMHVTARSLATHALSIFGDHSDVMACRQTGFAMLCSNSVQEAHDLALIAHMATLESRIPFLHFFDGFRTSHEVQKIEKLVDDDLRALINEQSIMDFRARALTPDAPMLRGSAQNPDVFFQARESCNPFYNNCAQAVRDAMAKFAAQVGREYHLVDYVGAEDAERVIIMMGSGAEAAHETVEHLVGQGEKVGLLKIRLYRPFPVEDLLAALPSTATSIAVLDRTKEPGGREPLYLDVVQALAEAVGTGAREALPKIIGGRYGLSSKEFTPAMVKAVFDELSKPDAKREFTVGIIDDVTHLSLSWDPAFDLEPADVNRSVFIGLGADGTVGANKNSIKIIGEDTPNWAQGYFVYDSKKSGAMTISHLRFGPRPIRSTYLIKEAQFVACHQPVFMMRNDVLMYAAPGGTFLLNSQYGPDEVFDSLPLEAQEAIIEKKLKFYVIDAYKVAGETGMGGRINTIMQTCFFAISGVLPRDEAIEQIKVSIKKTYGRKGDEIVQANWAAVDQTLANLYEVTVPAAPTTSRRRVPVVAGEAPEEVRYLTGMMMEGKGDLLPVSAFRPDGSFPTATTQYEKRTIAQSVPMWDPKVCIQCNKCTIVCPHAAIRCKVVEPEQLEGKPETFETVTFRGRDLGGLEYRIQVAPEDCTGCTLCVAICPAKDKANPRHKAINMTPLVDVLDQEREHYSYFLDLPDIDRTLVPKQDVKFSQFYRPLFEYSGACTGCGETPYIKLMTQLFGDRVVIGNATGCTSIYGGNLPTTPYATDHNGRGPAWSNSLFEDNAEFGFGLRLGVDSNQSLAEHLLKRLASQVGEGLVDEILSADQYGEANVAAQRERVAALKAKLAGIDNVEAKRLAQLADYLVRKSVWIIGGDGWAYDIGYGGLDHVLAQGGRDVNILVLDTEVYSNTGGQASKSTPIGASAKFASSGKESGKKDLGLMAMSYRHAYVASVALGARDTQTVQAFVEAESYPGPSIIIAYSHCIAHGYDLAYGLDQQKLAVQSGIWPLYRYDPRRIEENLPPLQLDSGEPRASVQDYMRNETRFRVVEKIDPKRFAELAVAAADFSAQRVALYQQMANIIVPFSAEDAQRNGDDQS